MSKILCTGGCGFLGTNLSAHALRNGYELHVFDNLSRVGSKNNLELLRQEGLKYFTQGDVRDKDLLFETIRDFQPDILFHVAGQVAMTSSIEDPRSDALINIVGTLNVLDACRKFSPDCSILYSSTNKVYGDLEYVRLAETDSRYVAIDYPNGFDETLALDFRSPYGCSKGSADQYVLDYVRTFNLKGAVFRHSSMYGDRQFATIDQGWVGWFAEKVIEISRSDSRSGTIIISGDGKQVRDMLHADDMVELYFQAATKMPNIYGNAFNIGGGISNAVSVRELISFFASELDVDVKIENKPWRASDQKVFVADLSKICQMLGWQPRVDYRMGLRSMLKWVERKNFG